MVAPGSGCGDSALRGVRGSRARRVRRKTLWERVIGSTRHDRAGLLQARPLPICCKVERPTFLRLEELLPASPTTCSAAPTATSPFPSTCSAVLEDIEILKKRAEGMAVLFKRVSVLEGGAEQKNEGLRRRLDRLDLDA